MQLLEAWSAFERKLGPENTDNVKKVKKMMPQKLNKERMTYAEDGVSALYTTLTRQTELGFEKFVEYVFPDDQRADPNLKLLQAAKMWKMRNQVD